MKTYVAWCYAGTFIVLAKNEIRAIQCAMEQTASHVPSDSWSCAPMSIYSKQVQDKIINSLRG